MILSLIGAIFVALKGWVIWWCWDVLGAVLAGVDVGGRGLSLRVASRSSLGRPCRCGFT